MTVAGRQCSVSEVTRQPAFRSCFGARLPLATRHKRLASAAISAALAALTPQRTRSLAGQLRKVDDLVSEAASRTDGSVMFSAARCSSGKDASRQKGAPGIRPCHAPFASIATLAVMRVSEWARHRPFLADGQVHCAPVPALQNRRLLTARRRSGSAQLACDAGGGRRRHDPHAWHRRRGRATAGYGGVAVASGVVGAAYRPNAYNPGGGLPGGSKRRLDSSRVTRTRGRPC
jgi:hypothetical protein